MRQAFEEHAAAYDRWFDDHPHIYSAQLSMLRDVVPAGGLMLEIGVGSGRFAAPLGIHLGLDPSSALIAMARRRGIEAVIGEGEHLPFRDNSCDTILMMTVICFLDDPFPVFQEACRLLKSGGVLVIGFIESGGAIATKYRDEEVKGRFLRHATYYSTEDVTRFFSQAGFAEIAIVHKARGFPVIIGKKL
ncbi:hypothetical protein RJ53_11055 [Methanocalculus chunghsingensis]|uniref:Methyltransferase type 11 domain-containing protein n=2 Tax=Methanocalculus chunghsingensis TaxID=156457 RepID=A0A8J8B518_9EURY|nr:hypothetical protein [Methanocalculus chunghsingensis]